MPKKEKQLPALRKIFNIGQEPQVEEDVVDLSYRSVSDEELKRIVKGVYTPDVHNRHIIDKSNIASMLEPIGKEMIERRVDNEKLTQLAPEIEQAASILIPSILSPNDFRKNIFNIVIKGGNESDEVKTEIIKFLTTHFVNEMELDTKISEWVSDAMFNSGAKAIMTLPTSTIGRLRDAIGTVEQLESASSTILGQIEGSLEELNTTSISNNLAKDTQVVDRIMDTKIFEEYIGTDNHPDVFRRQIHRDLRSGISRAAEVFGKECKIKFTDDPMTLFKPNFKNSAALEKIDSDVLKKLGADPQSFLLDRGEGVNKENTKAGQVNYQFMPYLDLSDYVVDNKSDSFPAVIELPTESVIPIILEGSPSNHIGYFIMVGENGSPISALSDNYQDMVDNLTGSQRISTLYSAFYGSSVFSIQKMMSTQAKAEILNSIYDSFIRSMMTTKLEKLGLENNSVEITNISRVMFTRLLRNAETRILFVPRRLMHYLAFKYNSDGSGRSRTENVKFPLSLKMTLVVTRLINLIESAVNRRNINITLDDGIGNPLEILRSIKKDVINNKLYGLTYDPSTIIKNVLDKEITIVPNKIPGVEDFSISDTPNNVEYPRPDDSLLDEIKNMFMLCLGVPPSAMNRLSEDEFSRSVAANNIFFSNQLKAQQRDVCVFMSVFIRTYISFSKRIQEGICDILSKETGEKVSGTIESKGEEAAIEAKKDKAADKDEDEKLPVSDRLANIIANLCYTLPSPNLAQDKSSFDELREYIEIIDTILNNLFPDDMVLDADVAATVKILRATIKRTILQAHIKDNSMLSDLNFDALGNVDIVGAVETNNKILNLKKALEDLVKRFNSEGGESGTPGSGWEI